MHETPLVSVISPSLNQVRFVRDALMSVASQDYGRIEHVIVDGGSTDGTIEVIREQSRPGLTLVIDEGSSQSDALNRAFSLSHGEIIGWINTDDALFGTDAVSTVVRCFSENPDALVVYGNAVNSNASGKSMRYVSTSASDLATVRPYSPLVQPAVFFRRSAVEGQFLRTDLHYKLDYELWVRLSRRGRFAKVNRVLAIDRNYGTRKSRAGADKGRVELQRIVDEYDLPQSRDGEFIETYRRWMRRISSVPAFMRLDRDYDLAFDGTFDSRWRRLIRQVFLTQSRLQSDQS